MSPRASWHWGYPPARHRPSGAVATAELPASSGAWRAGPTPGAPMRAYFMRTVLAADGEIKRSARIGVDGWLTRVWGQTAPQTVRTFNTRGGVRLFLCSKDDPVDAALDPTDHELTEGNTGDVEVMGLGVGNAATDVGGLTPGLVDIPFWIPVHAGQRFGVQRNTDNNLLVSLTWEVELRA